MIHRLLAGLVCLLPYFAVAQFEKNYLPSPIQDTIPAEIYTQCKQKIEKAKLDVQEENKKATAFLKSLYDSRFKSITATFNEDNIIVDAELTPYLQKIVDRIYDANPQLSREARVYAHRSGIPNALSFGDGTLAFTLGLLARMENESQIAFVLCHEIAHYHQKHSDKRFKELTQLNYDKELEKKINAARNSSYNSYTQSKELLKNLQLSISSHSRKDEFEADSVGLALFLRTNYDLKAPLQCMVILDSSDTGLYKNRIDLKKHFDFQAYPFKDTWLTYEKSTMWHVSEEDNEFKGSDTTRTHPDCPKRLKALQRQLNAYTGQATTRQVNPQGDAQAERIRIQSRFEVIESHYHFKKYGKALFQALLALETYPDNAYLHAMVGKCLYHLYMAQKEHELGKSVPLPDPRFDDNYDRFVTFIHQLRLTELASLAVYYTESKKESFYNDEEFIYAYWLCSQLPVSKTDPAKVKADYKARYPKGKYHALF